MKKLFLLLCVLSLTAVAFVGCIETDSTAVDPDEAMPFYGNTVVK